MDPYLVNGDCLEELKKIKDGRIDLIVTDPPIRLLLVETLETREGCCRKR